MAEYTYIFSAGKLSSGSPLPPFFTFGDVAVFNLTFGSGELQDGDRLTVAIDSNMEFFDPLSATGDASVMAVAHEDIDSEYDGASVQVEVPLNTDVFRQRVNGRENPLLVHVGIYRLRGEAYSELGKLSGYAFPVVAGPNTVSPVLPVTDYPTRQEAEALTDRSEAAADRAEQAAAGIVPPLQLSSPPTTSTAGSVGQLAVYHDSENNTDHLYHLVYITTSETATLYHWEECVLLNSNGLVPSSLLPIASTNVLGAVRCGTDAFSGLYMSGALIRLAVAEKSHINSRNTNRPITPGVLDYAVRSVLPNVTEIPAATSDYSLVDSSATTNNHSHVYSHSPSAVPTYRLPQVTNTTIAHYIELTVDFTNVQTYSFLDANGDALVPLFTPSIAAGDVYTFKMEYSAIKAAWLIYPQKQGAVADDFVMRGEVGAANGVAGLDANAKVLSGQLPIATNSSVGLVKGYVNGNYGINIDASGNVRVTRAEPTTDILPRTGSFKPIVPSNLNAAVTAALTDSNKISLTDAQKAAAQEVFGIGGPITEIPAATSEYTLSWGRFAHSPSLASVYVLPAVADGAIANDIVLSIKFSSSVLTYEFQDSAGTTLVPLPLNGDIEDGSVVTFLCRYQPLLSQWVIYPVMDGKEAQE
jgi:hypothetical protein